MKKIIIISIIALAFINVELSFSQNYDMRTKEGKKAAKREKKIDAVVGGINTIDHLSDENNRKEAKKSLNRNGTKVKDATKENYNKVKEAWKNRKKK